MIPIPHSGITGLYIIAGNGFGHAGQLTFDGLSSRPADRWEREPAHEGNTGRSGPLTRARSLCDFPSGRP
jgi:hypothetical protein